MSTLIQHYRGRRTYLAGAALAAALILAPQAGAQQHPAPGEHREHNPAAMVDHMVTHLTGRLQLSADQATRVRGILTEAGREMEALHQRAHTSGQHPAQGREHEPPAEVRALHERVEQQIAAVLNDRQRAQLQGLREEMHEAAMRMHGGRHGPGHGGGDHRPPRQ